mmetsp:Transcript_44561/g.115289  ORF Transcript_44561/g.115289 Transcript_44561/m.115289 type:complete len:234 (-) Transcript_44561:354-1055(-)
MASTTTAAPNLMHSFAMRRNSSSPSIRQMPFTMLLPGAAQRPSLITSQWHEVIMKGALAIFGSAVQMRMKWPIAPLPGVGAPSTQSESRLASSRSASLPHWSAHTAAAARSLASEPVALKASTSLLNFAEPICVHRWPTSRQPSSGVTTHASRPLRVSGGAAATGGSARFGADANLCAAAVICAAVTPAQPPTKLSPPSWAQSAAAAANFSGSSPAALGQKWHQLLQAAESAL